MLLNLTIFWSFILQVREQEKWTTKEQEMIKEKEALRRELGVAKSVQRSSGGSEGRSEGKWWDG